MKKAVLLFVFLCVHLFSVSNAHAAFGLVQWLAYNDDTRLLQCTDDIALMKQGDYAYSISFCDNAIISYEKNDDGSLNLVSTLVNDGNEYGVSPSNLVLLSPDEEYLYVVGRTKEGDNFREAIFVYEIDGLDGSLNQVQIFDDFGIGGGDLGGLMSRDGETIYIRTVGGYVYVLARAVNGVLSRVQRMDPTDGDQGRQWDMQLANDGSQLFLSASDGHLLYMNRDSSGMLSAPMEIDLSAVTDRTFYSFTFTKDLADIYAITSNDQLVHVELDDSLALLDATILDEPPVEHPGSSFFCPDDMVLSKNEKLLYFYDDCSGDLQMWGRDTDTGDLNYLDLQKEGAFDWPARIFSQVNELHFSDDGYYLYGAANDGVFVVDVTVDTELEFDAPSEVLIGELFEVEIDFTNNGPSTATNVEVQINVGAVEINDVQISGLNSACEIDSQPFLPVINCSIDELVDQAAQRITISLSAPAAAGDIDISATVSQDQLDKDSGSASQNVTVTVVDSQSTPGPTNTATPEPNANDDSEGGGAAGGLPGFLLFFLFLLRTRLRHARA